MLLLIVSFIVLRRDDGVLLICILRVTSGLPMVRCQVIFTCHILGVVIGPAYLMVCCVALMLKINIIIRLDFFGANVTTRTPRVGFFKLSVKRLFTNFKDRWSAVRLLCMGI
jgi:hypothetical protein